MRRPQAPARSPERVRGFAPIARADARILILGSLPGAESLRRREYYAQPRNAFWRIMALLGGASAELPYAARAAALIDRRVALWDVCRAARRAGSLDAAIETASVVANDFAGFYAHHPGIALVCFNGRTAAALYRRFVLELLRPPLRALPTRELPSTSPANAALTFEVKLDRWQAGLRSRPGGPRAAALF